MAIVRNVKVLNPTLEPAGDAVIQVTWLPLRQTTRPLILVVTLVSPDGEGLGIRHSYPGLGRTSTTFWQPGRVFTDVVHVPVDTAAATRLAPALVSVDIGLYDREADLRLPVYDVATGKQVSPSLLAEAKLPPPVTTAGAQAEGMARIGDALRLDSVEVPTTAAPGADIRVWLNWTVLAPLAQDCKLFVHLTPMDSEQQLAQIDEPIMNGRYPQRLWATGEYLSDVHTLQIPGQLPPGQYRLLIGLYPGEAWQQLLTIYRTDGSSNTSLQIGIIKIGR